MLSLLLLVSFELVISKYSCYILWENLILYTLNFIIFNPTKYNVHYITFTKTVCRYSLINMVRLSRKSPDGSEEYCHSPSEPAINFEIERLHDFFWDQISYINAFNEHPSEHCRAGAFHNNVACFANYRLKAKPP